MDSEMSSFPFAKTIYESRAKHSPEPEDGHIPEGCYQQNVFQPKKANWVVNPNNESNECQMTDIDSP